MPMSARPTRRHVRSALSLVILGATAAATTLAPAGPALARKDTTPVRQIAYQQWDSAADFASGTSSGTTVVGDQLQIGSPTGQFVYTDPFGAGSSATYDRATWTSPVVTTGFPYTELVSSWNAHTPSGTWVQLSVHGKADDGTTSKE
jgi:hypothetical protein